MRRLVNTLLMDSQNHPRLWRFILPHFVEEARVNVPSIQKPLKKQLAL